MLDVGQLLFYLCPALKFLQLVSLPCALLEFVIFLSLCPAIPPFFFPRFFPPLTKAGVSPKYMSVTHSVCKVFPLPPTSSPFLAGPPLQEGDFLTRLGFFFMFFPAVGFRCGDPFLCFLFKLTLAPSISFDIPRPFLPHTFGF